MVVRRSVNFGIAAAGLFVLLLPLGLLANPPHTSLERNSETGCALSDDDLNRNATLSFQQFDQSDEFPTSARSLSNRDCFKEAARATEHYLLHGPVATPGQRDVMTWHLGQFLAVTGDEQVAARLMATTRKVQDPAAELDWNTYVAGTWAFLVKDRKLLRASIASLSKSGPANRNNLAALERMSFCFEKSYREAYLGETCKPK